MGQTRSHWMYQPDTAWAPQIRDTPKFDPLLGFPNGRKERVMIATQEEMESGNIPLELRDYCAHKLLEYKACEKRNMPFLYRCGNVLHSYKACQQEDFILRMKEFEREKRLTAIQERNAKAGA